jgi:hypothetical protein
MMLPRPEHEIIAGEVERFQDGPLSSVTLLVKSNDYEYAASANVLIDKLAVAEREGPRIETELWSL